MIRRVNKILSVASLLVCGLMLAAWVRSYWVCDTLTRIHIVSTSNPADTATHSIFWEDGLLGYAVTQETYSDRTISAGQVDWWLSRRQPIIYHGQTLLQQIGFYDRMRDSSILDTYVLLDTGRGVFRPVHVVHGYTRDHWEIPGFLPAKLFAIYPAIHGYRRFRGGNKSGLCRQCNYDLTGNTSGVCPECGIALRPPAARPWR